MTSWSGGYVADAPYLVSYHPWQTPSAIGLATALCGVDWSPRERMTVADIGCGRGFTLGALAAANPGWTCLGLDYNPAMVAEAADFAEEAGLDNLSFHETDLSAMSDAELDALPMLDVAMLHGVWTWVGDPVRAGIVRLLARRLKPGGVVYMGYNAQPGFGHDAALQRLLRLGAAIQPRGDSVERVGGAIAFVRALKEAGAKGLAETIYLETLLKENELNVRYVAHEMLPEHWRPVFCADLCESLFAARLDYVGSTALVENIPAMMLSPEQRAIHDAVPEGVARETVKDVCMPRPFRRDVFMRGIRRTDRAVAIDRIMMALAEDLPEGLPPLATPVGSAAFPSEVTEPALAALREGPRTIGELRRTAPSRKTTPEEMLVLLSGTKAAVPLWRPGATAADAARARRFNEVAVRRYASDGQSEGQIGLVSSLMGAALPCSGLEALIAMRPELHEAPDMPAAVARMMPELNAEQVERSATIATKAVTERYPFWKAFGVI